MTGNKGTSKYLVSFTSFLFYAASPGKHPRINREVLVIRFATRGFTVCGVWEKNLEDRNGDGASIEEKDIMSDWKKYD